jgi:RNA polymerase sigma-70 factor (ECF subfamily)
MAGVIREFPSSRRIRAPSKSLERPTRVPTMPADEELVRRFRAGDEQAFDLLVARWSAPIFRLACRLTGERDAADDVRQMALLQLYRGLNGFEERARLSTWLQRVVVNLCTDRRRAAALGQRSTDTLEAEAWVAPDAPTPGESCANGELAALVARAVLALPVAERVVVVLRHYHDLPFPEIAAIVGAPVSTVKSRMAKGLRSLRVRLPELRGEMP